ncbi:hypothetical protein DFJ77DRAFT_507632 [Powellomyces hirtus]|nr:hypothetical protein DFJ77DRAFT_507632 [Powellomyces hirtus]
MHFSPLFAIILATAAHVHAQGTTATMATPVAPTLAAPSPTPVVIPTPVGPLPAGDTGCNVFDRCKTDIEAQLENTCPGLASNQTLFAACQCIFAKNMNNCYGNCPDNAAVVAQGVQQAGTVTQLCAAAGLDPNRLPTVAPWQTVFSTTSTSTLSSATIRATSTATATATATATKAPDATAANAAVAATAFSPLVYLGPVVVGLVGALVVM